MYDFDKAIDRRGTTSIKWNKQYAFGQKDGLLPFWIADTDFASVPEILDAIKERCNHPVIGYSEPLDSVYTAIQGWWERRHQWKPQTDWMLLSYGVVTGIYFTLNAVVPKGGKVLVFTPVYDPFFAAVKNSGHTLVDCPLDHKDNYYSINFQAFEEELKNGVEAVVICNPHNPSGRVWKEEELKKMGEIIEKHHLWVISDEIHCDLLRRDQRHIPLGKVMPDYGRLVTCMAPSKTFNLAGMMISNIIIRDDGLREIWLSRHYNFDNPLSIAAAQAAYEKGEPWLEELQAYLDENFRFTGEYLKEHLPGAKFRISEATYLAWVDLNAYFEPDEHLPLFFAYKAGVLLEGGNMFVQNSDGFIRLNLACPRATLAEGLRRICEAVNTKHTEKYLGE